MVKVAYTLSRGANHTQWIFSDVPLYFDLMYLIMYLMHLLNHKCANTF
jgi:hypothetical protein